MMFRHFMSVGVIILGILSQGLNAMDRKRDQFILNDQGKVDLLASRLINQSSLIWYKEEELWVSKIKDFIPDKPVKTEKKKVLRIDLYPHMEGSPLEYISGLPLIGSFFKIHEFITPTTQDILPIFKKLLLLDSSYPIASGALLSIFKEIYPNISQIILEASHAQGVSPFCDRPTAEFLYLLRSSGFKVYCFD